MDVFTPINGVSLHSKGEKVYYMSKDIIFLSDRCLRFFVLFGNDVDVKSFKDEIEIIESLSSASSYVTGADSLGFNPDRILFKSTFCGPRISGLADPKFDCCDGVWARSFLWSFLWSCLCKL